MSLVELHRTVAKPIASGASPLVYYIVATVLMTSAIVVSFALSMSDWTPATFVALPLVAITALWISGGAATAVLGLFTPAKRPVSVPSAWSPTGRTAILVTLCGEDPVPLAHYLTTLRGGLNMAGLSDTTDIFVLSDTSNESAIAVEHDTFVPLQTDGTLNYRRRSINVGRKPGNIAGWLATHGDAFDYMLVLDADSRMSVPRIRKMIWQIEKRTDLGLLQAGIALVPGVTRFGHHQRVAARMLSKNFGRGFAAWSGNSGNYWGHNAIMRTAAFREAAQLPSLSGAAPFGGDILSHDFIEAAWMRRAGWAIVLDPDPVGSAENAPQTLSEFHRRDRRWCQGNLQHLRLLAEPGLCTLSRAHLAAGIVSYLAAPLWLALIALIASGAVPISGALPLLLVATVLLLPKFCALVDWMARARTLRRKLITMRALVGELFVSSLTAPLVMVRHAGSVASVCLGRDCGWKSGRTQRFRLPEGIPEMAIGAGLLLLAWQANNTAVFWLAPVVLPLCAAPLIARMLNAPA
ncbi:MAG: glucans biosynthesis glucosyltransferase MdoH [Pseudomonadota bacterium]